MMLSRRAFGTGVVGLAAAGAMPRAAHASTVLRYGNASNEKAMTNQFIAEFGRVLDERTKGELTIQMLLGMSSEQTIAESVALGTLDMALGGYTGIPQFDALYTPYLLDGIPHGVRVMQETEIGEKAAAALAERYNAKLLGVGASGPFLLSMRDPVSSWEDLRGRKIRVPPFASYGPAVELLGGIPTPVPFNEVYLAMQQGVVDGLVTVLNVMVANRFYEVSPYVITNDFGVGLDKCYISKPVYDGLDPDLRKVFDDTYNEVAPKLFIQRGLDQAERDLEAWRAANGPDNTITLDSAYVTTLMEPLSRKFANEAFGKGAFELIRSVA
jgi:TRAP-type C4-dicarboxylate transport system substrate-binding protein